MPKMWMKARLVFLEAHVFGSLFARSEFTAAAADTAEVVIEQAYSSI